MSDQRSSTRRQNSAELSPDVHPETPARIDDWHEMMLGHVSALQTWPLLAQHLLVEIRQCPTCKRPVLRWRRLEEIQAQVLEQAFHAARGNASVAARRLRMSRRSFYNHAPKRLRKRLDEKPNKDKPATGDMPQESGSYLGSSLDSLLAADGTLDEVTAEAKRRVASRSAAKTPSTAPADRDSTRAPRK